MIKNKNMLIFVNKNLIKFSTYLERNFFLVHLSTEVNKFWIQKCLQFLLFSSYFHRVYFAALSSIVNCNFGFHVKRFFSRRLHTMKYKSSRPLLQKGENDSSLIGKFMFAISTENKFRVEIAFRGAEKWKIYCVSKEQSWVLCVLMMPFKILQLFSGIRAAKIFSPFF